VKPGQRSDRDLVFAGIVARFATAIARFRGRRGGSDESAEVEFTETTLLWDDDDDGGLAAARVPRRPPDRSGSGSAAMIEPPMDDEPRAS